MPHFSVLQIFADHELHLIAKAGEHLMVLHRMNASGSYVLEVAAEAGASVTMIGLQTGDAQAVTIRQHSTLAEGAHVCWQNITLGSGHIEHTLISECTGHHAESSVDWLFHAGGNDQFDLRARNVFSGRDGSGEILMRGVAEHHASVSCHGMIAIGPGGGGTNTYLTQEVLMLDATAKVDAVPGLEIKTNDVKASHSATVSKVSPDDLFYFCSRGIDRDEARAMFIRGFLEELVQRIENPDVREEILAALETKSRA